MNRQIRRLEKAVDELTKIHDDGKGTEGSQKILDLLWHEITLRDSESTTLSIFEKRG